MNSRLMRKHPSQRLFFLSATVLAIVGPWLLLLTLTGQLGLSFTIQTHAKSMLFGFVGALIAGYLVGKQSLYILLLLYGLWLLGRFLELFSDGGLVTSVAYSAYGFVLAALVVPKFKAAKKWRNKTMVPLLALIGSFPFFSMALPRIADSVTLSNISFLLMISTLMFFMGGRLLAPSVTRAYAESKLPIIHRVQPYLEGTILALLFGAIATSLFSAPIFVTSSLSLAASLLIFLRLYRWRLYKLSISYSSLWGFVAGYIWLATGLLVFSLTILMNQPVQSSIHIITVGALGTLSSTVILRFCVTKTEVNSRWYYLAILILAAAAITRYTKALLPEISNQLLALSAVLWSLNFAIILFGICRRIVLDSKLSKRPETRAHLRSQRLSTQVAPTIGERAKL